MVVLGGGSFSYERSTSVAFRIEVNEKEESGKCRGGLIAAITHDKYSVGPSIRLIHAFYYDLYDPGV